jgi:quercetin dioxygenase-like cupin family protein
MEETMAEKMANDKALSAKVYQTKTGETYRVVTDLVTFIAVAEDTGGAYSLFETVTQPGGGTPPHLQHFEDESFYVLEGEYTFLVGDQPRVLHAGDHAFVPRETVHAYTNTGDAPGRMLIMTNPGGIHEKFFAEAGEPIADPSNPPAPSGPPNIPLLLAVAPKYGIDILPPPAE